MPLRNVELDESTLSPEVCEECEMMYYTPVTNHRALQCCGWLMCHILQIDIVTANFVCQLGRFPSGWWPNVILDVSVRMFFNEINV